MTRGHQFTLVGLITCVAIGIMVVAFLAGGVRRQRGGEFRIKCSNNLRSLTLALKLYANENRGRLPRTVFDPQNPAPVWGTPYAVKPDLGAHEGANPFVADDHPAAKYRPAANDVTAALFLFARTQDITLEVFVCPSTKQRPLDLRGRTAQAWTNWPGNKALARHLSYSYDNLYSESKEPPSEFRLANVVAVEVPLLSDMNPGIPELLQITTQSGSTEMRRGNSRNHGGDGQNVSYLDGHVSWESHPFVGVQRDNIYTAGGRELKPRRGEPAIVGPPFDANDTVMLPTSAVIAR